MFLLQDMQFQLHKVQVELQNTATFHACNKTNNDIIAVHFSWVYYFPYIEQASVAYQTDQGEALRLILMV